MKIVARTCAVILFALALVLALTGIGVLGASSSARSVLDSPEASGKMFAGLLPAILFCAGGVWLWQRPKPTT